MLEGSVYSKNDGASCHQTTTNIVHDLLGFLIMEWERFPCSLLLPQTLATKHYVAELKDYSAPTEKLNISRNEEVGLYGNIKVNKKVRDCWLENLKKRKYVVKLPKLTDADINLWQPIDESWKQIDPYSKLEDIGGINTDTNTLPSNNTVSHLKSSYTLWSRKPKNYASMVQPTRKAKVNIKYSNFYSDQDLCICSEPRLKPATSIKPCAGLSKSRIDAQWHKTEEPKVKHPIPVSKPSAVKSSEDDSVPDADDGLCPKNDSCKDASEDEITLSVIKKNLEPQSAPKKGIAKFVTRDIGICKYKCKRYYKCPVCAKKFSSQGELNDHHRQKHDQVSCSCCKQSFKTPSTLIRHMYTHAKPRFHCWCGKGFYFKSDLTIHKVTHKRIKNHICIHPGCGHSYFSSNELAKHVQIHKGVMWSCTLCNYKTPDKRLLKSHQRKHNQTPRYFCPKCNKGFTYHAQWSRHVMAKKCQ